MKTNILVSAASLSDQDLLARLEVLAGKEREASVELVAHLAALDSRPGLYAARGYGSLFSYCIQALRLSEDAACNRIEAARACRRFPLILELMASGSLTLTSVRLLARHLTADYVARHIIRLMWPAALCGPRAKEARPRRATAIGWAHNSDGQSEASQAKRVRSSRHGRLLGGPVRAGSQARSAASLLRTVISA